jgi:hypothetical protein
MAIKAVEILENYSTLFEAPSTEAALLEQDANYAAMRNRILTSRRVWINPIDPMARDINIYDIAHALSQICRYGGHTPVFYSVAEHSLRVADVLDSVGAYEYHLAGLMHDSAEAYLSDITAPVKHNLVGYDAYEDRMLQCICERFNILPVAKVYSDVVKFADRCILATEMRDLFNDSGYNLYGTPLIEPLLLSRVMSPSQASNAFLDRFKDYGGDLR